ncbi:hypothetical protein CR513_48274, partial [Mucuna pruriens]
EELLRFLKQHAILVWGPWTAKSSLLYPRGGVETLARDYTLLLFSKNLKVQSSDVNNCLKIFGLERYDLIKTTGQSILHWKFREIPDESFKKLYPNIVEKQEELFKGLELIWKISDQRVTSLGGVSPGRNRDIYPLVISHLQMIIEIISGSRNI